MDSSNNDSLHCAIPYMELFSSNYTFTNCFKIQHLHLNFTNSCSLLNCIVSASYNDNVHEYNFTDSK